jgi:hypothetical protein
MINFKIVSGDKALLDNDYPMWMCDVRKRHFGLVKVTIKNLQAGETKTVYEFDHNLGYVPSYLVAWNYPKGTAPSGNTRQTFGIGALDPLSPISYSFRYEVDSRRFRIVASDASSNVTDDYAEFRFYIFVNDFPVVTSATF